MAACDESPNLPGGEKTVNDSVYLVNTIDKKDTLNCDTIFDCQLSDASEKIYNKLLGAYQDKNQSLLVETLLEWENAYSADVVHDSIEHVYDVYKEFYSPWNLDRILESEFGNNVYEGLDFYVIQTSIEYTYSFREWNHIRHSIDDFKPSIMKEDVHVLYLTSTYESAINCYLGADNSGFSLCYSLYPPIPFEEMSARASFLGKHLDFFRGHWGNYWHLETHPEVEHIAFNTTKDSAQVHFRFGYQGGEVILGKDDHGWNIVDHYMTWIE